MGFEPPTLSLAIGCYVVGRRISLFPIDPPSSYNCRILLVLVGVQSGVQNPYLGITQYCYPSLLGNTAYKAVVR
jgi:hypothetical protein